MTTDKDPRTYVRIHDGMPDHPKVDGLSDAAFRLLVTMWCWCSRHLTDGRIPAATWEKRGEETVREELMSAGLVDLREDGSFQMHDYTVHQRTAEEVNRIREARREAGSKGGKARAKVVANAKAKAKQTGSKSVAETETEVLTNVSTTGGFADFWSSYPRKVGKPAAEKAYNAAIKRGVDPQYLVTTTERFAEISIATDPKFIPHPTTWLNQERYNDVDTPAASPAPRKYPPTQVPDWLDPNDAEGYAKWMREAMQ